jgi:hypothetical protein
LSDNFYSANNAIGLAGDKMQQRLIESLYDTKSIVASQLAVLLNTTTAFETLPQGSVDGLGVFRVRGFSGIKRNSSKRQASYFNIESNELVNQGDEVQVDMFMNFTTSQKLIGDMTLLTSAGEVSVQYGSGLVIKANVANKTYHLMENGDGKVEFEVESRQEPESFNGGWLHRFILRIGGTAEEVGNFVARTSNAELVVTTFNENPGITPGPGDDSTHDHGSINREAIQDGVEILVGASSDNSPGDQAPDALDEMYSIANQALSIGSSVLKIDESVSNLFSVPSLMSTIGSPFTILADALAGLLALL